MDVYELKIQLALYNQEPITNYLTNEEISEYINRYKYPIAIIPQQGFNVNIYNNNSFKHNQNYLRTALSEVFNEYYNSEEIEKIVYYFLNRITTIDKWPIPDLQQIINSSLNSSDKPEIRYCLIDVKYQIALYYSHNLDEHLNDFNKLLTELEPYQSEYNNFLFYEHK